jgi:hypothetical protein
LSTWEDDWRISLQKNAGAGFFSQAQGCLRFGRPWPHLMIRLHHVLILGVFVCTANCLEAGSQTLQGGEPTTQMGTLKANKAKKINGSRATLMASPVLCFRSGSGWRRVPTTELSTPDIPSKDSSGNIGANRSAAGGETKYVDTKPASAKPTASNECPEMPFGTIKPVALLGDVTTSNHVSAMSSAPSTEVSPETLAPFPGTSLLGPPSGVASGRPTRAPGSMPSGRTYLATGSESDVSAEQVKVLKSHAYVSSITLRRMMRNASDMETRIKLRELQSKQSHKAHVSTVRSKGNVTAKGRSKDHHVGKGESSSVSDGDGRAAFIARKTSFP